MYVEFDKMPPRARVWVYQFNRPASEAEESVIHVAMKAFCESWEAHGQSLLTSYAVWHHHFLILSVDEAEQQASGCSIDGSVHVLKMLQAELDIDFFDRKNVAFLINNDIKLVRLEHLKENFTSGKLNPMSITFNNLVPTREEWLKEWMVPVKSSWVARYLPKAALA